MKVLFFTADWCPTCKAMYPVWEKIIVNNTGIDYSIEDCTSSQEEAIKYRVSQLPTFVMVDDLGNEVGRFNGFKNETSFQKWIECLG